MTDYIMLPRSMLDRTTSVVHRGIFLSMLERANEQGQLTISVRAFADEIGLGYQVVRTAIEKLSANAIINAIVTQRLTQITICEFAGYISPPRKRQRNSNATANAIEPQPKQTRFTPPTEEQVRQYIAEKGYHFDPAQFVPFYKSKGWKIGKEPMKDWRAACHTWEIRWKEKHGEQFYHQIAQSTDRYASEREANRQRVDRGLRAAMDVVARENGF